MTTAMIVWTSEPLPPGVAAALGPPCRTCGCTQIQDFDGRLPLTRSTGPVSGRYVVQPHMAWCPVWTGETPELPCPHCGAPVEVINADHGFSLTVPSARFGTEHLIGTADEVLGHPAAVFATQRPRWEPSLDKVVVGPCGHELHGEVAAAVVAAHAEIRVARGRAEADAIIVGTRALLDAAEAAGHGALAEAYRAAVRGHTRDVSGLLAALRLLHPEAGAQ